MNNLQKGERISLSQPQLDVTVSLTGADYVVAALGVKKEGKIYKIGDQEWLALDGYNRTGEGAVSLQQNTNRFSVELSRVPTDVERVVFTASVDENKVVGTPRVQGGVMDVSGRSGSVARYEMTADHLTGGEQSIILGEAYRHNGAWKLKAVGEGYSGGFPALLKSFGVEISDESAPSPSLGFGQAAPAPASVPTGINLQKQRLVDLEKKAPKLVDLAKRASVSLEKAGLGDLPAMQVYAVLDASWSMDHLYDNKTVQNVAERILAAAAILDDDGSVPLIRFGEQAVELDPIDLTNFAGHIGRQIGRDYDSDTLYAPPLELVRDHEPDSWHDVDGKLQSSTMPRLVFFMTDGQNGDMAATERVLRELSKTPTFVVMVGIGDEDFSELKKLENLDGRLTQNVKVLTYKDIGAVSEDQLYHDIIEPLPTWLEKAREIGLVNDNPKKVAQDQTIMANLNAALTAIAPAPQPRQRRGFWGSFGGNGPR